MADDSILLSRYAASGDEAAFAEFVARHINVVYSSALRRVGGDRHFAEDVTQQVFCAVASNAARLAKHPMITGWLFTATRNIAGQLVRTEVRRKARDRDAPMPEACTVTSTGDPNWPSVARYLDRALDELSAIDRAAILLRFLHHQGYAEIGRSLQLSDDAARMRVDRAMQKLRALLARHGVTSSAAAIGAAMSAFGAETASTDLVSAITTSAIAGAKAAGTASASSGWPVLVGAKLVLGLVGTALVSGIVYGLLSSRQVRQTDIGEARLAAERNRPPVAERTFEPRVDSLKPSVTSGPNARTVSLAPASNAARAADTRSADSTGVPSEVETKQISDAITKALHTDPELSRLRIEDARNRLRIRCAPLLRSLGLAPAQISTFEELVLRRAAAGTQLMAEKFNRGLAEESAEYVALKQRADLETHVPTTMQLRALLGDEGYAEFQQQERASVALALSDALRAAAHLPATPFTSQQSAALAELFAETGEKRASITEWTKAEWDAVVARAEAILLPDQLTAVSALREEADGQRQIAERREALRRQIIDAAIDRPNSSPRGSRGGSGE